MIRLCILVALIGTHVAIGYPSGESYDFIVVGGGVAGCTIASRLSETGRYSVVLIEAGGYPEPALDVPAFGDDIIDTGEYTKDYETVRGRGGRSVIYTVGRTLGGGSAVNGMVFNRGSPHDFDYFGNFTGNMVWNYENMLGYFKKVENYMGDWPSSDAHGYNGHITVSRPKYTPGMTTILKAGKYLGYPVADQNGPQQVSFTPIEFSKGFGRRVSSFSGYVKPYLGVRSNLKVITEAKVDKILFDENRKVVGVSYSKQNSIYFVKANKEVVVSAGVVESPALLMRSGIGPKDELDQAGIPILKELPVGKNLHDHVIVRLQFLLNDSSQVHLPDRELTLENYWIYNVTGEGPYSTHDADNVQAFLVSSSQKRTNWPDIQFQFVSSGTTVPPPEDARPGEYPVSCMVYLTRPKSRGSLTLNPRNPYEDPILDFQFLKDPYDIEILLEGIQKALQVYERTPSFRKIGARYSHTHHRKCHKYPFRSRDYWKCYVKHEFQAGLHGAGSCKMGSAHDPTSVVDPTLCVLGVQGLRVADASIMPQVTNANTQAPVYAIAEKAAQTIMDKWGNQWNGLSPFKI